MRRQREQHVTRVMQISEILMNAARSNWCSVTAVRPQLMIRAALCSTWHIPSSLGQVLPTCLRCRILNFHNQHMQSLFLPF